MLLEQQQNKNVRENEEGTVHTARTAYTLLYIM